MIVIACIQIAPKKEKIIIVGKVCCQANQNELILFTHMMSKPLDCQMNSVVSKLTFDMMMLKMMLFVTYFCVQVELALYFYFIYFFHCFYLYIYLFIILNHEHVFIKKL